MLSEPVPRVTHRHRRAQAAVGRVVDLVAQRLQRAFRGLGKPVLQVQLARVVHVGVEGVHVTGSGKPGRFHRLLRVHAEHQRVQDQLQVALHLVVAAGAAHGHHRLAVLRQDVVHQRGAGPLARLDHVGVTRFAVEHFDPRAQAGAQFGEEHRLGERPPADGAAHQVAMPVQHRHMRRAVVRRGVRPDGRGHDLRCGAPGLLGEPPWISGGPLFGVGALGIDLPGADCGVFLGQQTVHGHRREVGIPVKSLPVAEAQLQRLGHRVDVGRAVVPHRLEIEVLQDVQRLHQHGPLRPGVVPPHLVAVEGGAHRFAELGVVSGQVLQSQDAAHLPRFPDDQLRSWSFVESAPRRLQAFGARAGR